MWLIRAGRGFGKTRSGAEWIYSRVQAGFRRIALINDTAADVRDVMIEGPSGLIAISPPWDKPRFEPSNRRLTWPNGAMAISYAAEAPDLLRGPEHDTAWCDELAKWKNLRKKDTEGGTAWDNLMMGLRIGDNPQCVITTTPRPVPLIKQLRARPSTVETVGSSYENRANLSDDWYAEVIAPYEGTRLGRQEIHAELLEDVEGALWHLSELDEHRVEDIPRDADGHPLLSRVVIGVDPNASNTEHSDEMGIIVVGVALRGNELHGYVLGDYTLRGSPKERGEAVIKAYVDHQADAIVPEVNNGGDMVEYLIRSVVKPGMIQPRIIPVHASRGKLTRAEPVSTLYEKGQGHHVGAFSVLEDEMCTWTPGQGSPNRLDALVWAYTELFKLTEQPKPASGTRPLAVNLSRRFGH